MPCPYRLSTPTRVGKTWLRDYESPALPLSYAAQRSSHQPIKVMSNVPFSPISAARFCASPLLYAGTGRPHQMLDTLRV